MQLLLWQRLLIPLLRSRLLLLLVVRRMERSVIISVLMREMKIPLSCLNMVLDLMVRFVVIFLKQSDLLGPDGNEGPDEPTGQ